MPDTSESQKAGYLADAYFLFFEIRFAQTIIQ